MEELCKPFLAKRKNSSNINILHYLLQKHFVLCHPILSVNVIYTFFFYFANCIIAEPFEKKIGCDDPKRNFRHLTLLSAHIQIKLNKIVNVIPCLYTLIIAEEIVGK